MHGMARNDPEEGEMDETALRANVHFVDFISLVFIFLDDPLLFFCAVYMIMYHSYLDQLLLSLPTVFPLYSATCTNLFLL